MKTSMIAALSVQRATLPPGRETQPTPRYQGGGFFSALANMFSNRAGAICYTVSLSNCFTDTGGTTPATVGDTVAFMSDVFGNKDSVWTTETTRPTLRQDGDGLYYLELSDGAHAASQTDALDFTDTDFGAVMVALRDDAQSGLSTLISTQSTSPSRYVGLMNTGSGSASGTLNSSSVGTIHINDGADLEADGTTRAQLADEFEGLIGVLSGRGLNPETVENNWAFYTYLASPAPTGRFYMGLVVPGMTEVERVAAVALVTTQYGVATPAPAAFVKADWRVLRSYGDWVDIEIDNLPDDSGSALTDVAFFDGTTFHYIGSANTGIHRITGMTEDDIVVCDLRASNGTLGPASNQRVFQVKPLPTGLGSGLHYYDPDHDWGTTGDIFVDVVNGSDDTGTGAENDPYASISEALDNYTAGDVIKLRASKDDFYEVSIDLPSDVSIEAYGTEVVNLSGGVDTSGWAVTTGADSDFLGAVDPANVYKITIPTSTFPNSNPSNLNIMEDGVLGALSSMREDQSQLIENRANEETFLVADSTGATFTLDVDDNIIGVTDPDVLNLTNFPDPSVLVGKQILLRANPTVIATDVFVKSVDITASTHSITLERDLGGSFSDDTNAEHQDGDPDGAGSQYNQYTIENIGQALDEPGSYAYEESGTDTIIYYRPHNPNDLANIRVCGGEHGVQLSSGAINNGLRGLNFLQLASSGSHSGAGVIGSDTDGLVVEGCSFHGIISLEKTSYGVRLMNDNNARIRNNHFFEISGQGIRPGNSALNLDTGIWIYLNVIDRTGSDAISTFFLNEGIIALNFIDRVGLEAHSSMVKAYAVGMTALYTTTKVQKVIIMGNVCTPRSNGYVPMEAAGDMYIFGNFFPIGSKKKTDARMILLNVNPVYTTPRNTRDMWVFNNTVPGQFGNNDLKASIDVLVDQLFEGGQRVSTLRPILVNNVAYSIEPRRRLTNSGTVIDPYSAEVVRRHGSNVMTELRTAAFGITLADYDPENAEATQDELYVDPETSDFTLVANSAIHTTAPQDVRDLIDVLENDPAFSGWPHFDKDYLGNTVDWDVPWIGADSTATNTASGPFLRCGETTVDGTTVTVKCTSDTGTGTVWAVLYDRWDQPTKAECHARTGAADSDSVVAPGTSEQTFTFTGLTEGDGYKVFFFEDTGPICAGDGFEIVRTDLPVITDYYVDNIGSGTLDLHYTLDSAVGEVVVFAADTSVFNYPDTLGELYNDTAGNVALYHNIDTSPVAGANTVSLTGLDTYSEADDFGAIFIAHFDAAGDALPAVRVFHQPYETGAYTLTDPTITITGATTADGSVDTDGADGTLYAAFYQFPFEHEPERHDSVDEQIQTGRHAAWSGSVAITAAGVQTFSATGLEAGVEGYWYFAHYAADGTPAPGVQSVKATPASVGAGGLTVEQEAISANSDHENGTAYPPVSFTPVASDNELLAITANHNSDGTTASATWDGSAMTSLLQSTAGDPTRIDVMSVFQATTGGTSAADFVQTPAGESNAMGVVLLEVAGLSATPIAQHVVANNTSSEGADVSATITGVTAGNLVVAVLFTSEHTEPVTAGGLMNAAFGSITSAESGDTGGTSDLTAAYVLIEDATAGDYTAEFDYVGGAQGTVIILEIETA